jgi:hypothetical protein
LKIANNNSIVIEAGIFASHIIWLIRTREIRAQAKAEGKTFDDIAEEHERNGTPFAFAERKKRSKSADDESTLEEGISTDERIPGQGKWAPTITTPSKNVEACGIRTD